MVIFIRGGTSMLNSIILTISATLTGYAVILNRIMALSATPELAPVVAGTFLLGLIGVIYSISTLKSIGEWLMSKV